MPEPQSFISPSATEDNATIRIQVLFFPDEASRWERRLSLRAGSSIAEALQAIGFAEAFPDHDLDACGVGIYGTIRPLDFLLQDNDRVEIYQPLRFDPMESRRRRARHKANGPKKPKAVKVAVRT